MSIPKHWLGRAEHCATRIAEPLWRAEACLDSLTIAQELGDDSAADRLERAFAEAAATSQRSDHLLADFGLVMHCTAPERLDALLDSISDTGQRDLLLSNIGQLTLGRVPWVSRKALKVYLRALPQAVVDDTRLRSALALVPRIDQDRRRAQLQAEIGVAAVGIDATSQAAVSIDEALSLQSAFRGAAFDRGKLLGRVALAQALLGDAAKAAGTATEALRHGVSSVYDGNNEGALRHIARTFAHIPGLETGPWKRPLDRLQLLAERSYPGVRPEICAVLASAGRRDNARDLAVDWAAVGGFASAAFADVLARLAVTHDERARAQQALHDAMSVLTAYMADDSIELLMRTANDLGLTFDPSHAKGLIAQVRSFDGAPSDMALTDLVPAGVRLGATEAAERAFMSARRAWNGSGHRIGVLPVVWAAAYAARAGRPSAHPRSYGP